MRFWFELGLSLLFLALAIRMVWRAARSGTAPMPKAWICDGFTWVLYAYMVARAWFTDPVFRSLIGG